MRMNKYISACLDHNSNRYSLNIFNSKHWILISMSISIFLEHPPLLNQILNSLILRFLHYHIIFHLRIPNLLMKLTLLLIKEILDILLQLLHNPQLYQQCILFFLLLQYFLIILLRFQLKLLMHFQFLILILCQQIHVKLLQIF